MTESPPSEPEPSVSGQGARLTPEWRRRRKAQIVQVDSEAQGANSFGRSEGAPLFRALRGGSANVLQHGAGLLLGLVVTQLAGSRLDPRDFGFFALTATLVSLLQFGLDHGTGALALRRLGAKPWLMEPLLARIWAHRKRLGVCLGLVALSAGFAESEAGRRAAYFALALTAPAYGPLGLVPALVISGRLSHFALAATALRAAATGVFGLLAVFGAAAWMWPLVLLGREVLAARVPRWVLRGAKGAPVRPRAPRSAWVFSRAAAGLGLAGLLQQLYFQGDVWVVRAVLGDEAVGTYAAAARLVNPVALAPALFLQPFVPLLATGDRASLERAIARVLRIGAVAGGMLVLAAHLPLLLGEDASAWLRIYGGRYEAAPTDARAAFALLALVPLAIGPGAAAMTALTAAGRFRVVLGISATALATNVALNLILLPFMGVAGAALATLATELVVAVLSRSALRCSWSGTWLGLLVIVGFAVAQDPLRLSVDHPWRLWIAASAALSLALALYGLMRRERC